MFFNEWDEINELPDDAFDSHPFDEVLSDACTWTLPGPYCAVIRSYNRKKGKLKEYVYKNITSAHKKLAQLANNGEEITILTNEIIGTINYDPTE